MGCMEKDRKEGDNNAWHICINKFPKLYSRLV